MLHRTVKIIIWVKLDKISYRICLRHNTYMLRSETLGRLCNFTELLKNSQETNVPTFNKELFAHIRPTMHTNQRPESFFTGLDRSPQLIVLLWRYATAVKQCCAEQSWLLCPAPRYSSEHTNRNNTNIKHCAALLSTAVCLNLTLHVLLRSCK